MKPRTRMGLAGVALLLAGCGHSSTSKPRQTSTGASSAPQSAPHEVAPGIVTGSAGGVTATLHAGTHHPRSGHPWPFSFTVSSKGRPARASVSYQYLFAGQVVARRSHYTFTGHFSDVSSWPPSAVGYPLTFRAVIVSEGVTIYLDYPVQVTR